MDFLLPDFRRNPFPEYDHLRSISPLLHDPQTGLWMIFDYDSVKRALSDFDAFSSSPATAGHPHPQWMIFFDPPRHTKLRALIMRAFTPRVIAELEDSIRELSRDLLDRAMTRSEMELAEEYTVPLPMMVIARLLGIPDQDWALFKRWSDVILRLSYTMFDAAESASASLDYYNVTAEMSEYLRTTQKSALLTKLADAEIDGERLTHEEILAFFQLLLVAGNETTTNLINNAVLCLMDHPDQFARLRAQPELVPSAIEEVLRYRSPIQWMYRATRREVKLHEQTIPAGKLVLAMIGSANRDPTQFHDPGCFDIGREPNPHIAFSHGIHFCLGAALSRLEARIALNDLLDRTEAIGPANDEPWEPRRALNVHGPTRLAIRFTPRRVWSAGLGSRA